jgi:pyruvate kinase
MVARWDLWIEVPIEKLPYYQKQIVDGCQKMWKFYIVATHLLESMIEQPFPTRAEVSDIYNAVMQNSDCLMLSGESAMWKYPIECAQMMTNVIKQAESDKDNTIDTFTFEGLWKKGLQKKNLMKQAIALWESIDAKALCIYTEYGFLAKMWAAFKAKIPMFAFTNNKKTANLTNALYNVQWVILDNFSHNYENNLEESLTSLKESHNIKSWDKVIVIWDLQKNNQEIPVIKIMEI